ncbi:hypothetical protein [uncultured Friedmanniella sp.]|uniref:hypothetical protein n=1 Tax=uncultured Friedmanniella sp. TaxID=335381 RepID=UPI0035CAF865
MGPDREPQLAQPRAQPVLVTPAQPVLVTPARPGPLGPAAVQRLQAGAGNRAVASVLAGKPTVQRAPKPPSQAAALARLATLRTNADQRVTLATQYATATLGLGDTTREKLAAISTVYTAAFGTFRGVLNAAQQEAQNQQRWTDIVVGVICGTAAGLAAAFVLPSTAAGWFALTLAEAGTAAASSAVQGVASAGVASVASGLTQVAGQSISSAGLEPSIQQVAMWQKVAAIYRSGLEVAPLSQASHQAAMALADLVADVRVWEAGGTSTLTPETLATRLAQLEQQDAQLTAATTQLTTKLTELAALRAAADAINPQAKSQTQVERDIWVQWMATLAPDSNILDIDAIEDHIGPKGLRIVDFGIYTSDADENEAIEQARNDAMFLQAEASGGEVARGQIIGGPHH